MDRGKIIAIVTGVISVAIALAYLILVQLLDFRGEMIPAPVSLIITQIAQQFGNFNQTLSAIC